MPMVYIPDETEATLKRLMKAQERRDGVRRLKVVAVSPNANTGRARLIALAVTEFDRRARSRRKRKRRV